MQQEGGYPRLMCAADTCSRPAVARLAPGEQRFFFSPMIRLFVSDKVCVPMGMQMQQEVLVSDYARTCSSGSRR